MLREPGNAQSRATIFRHSDALSFPAVLLCKVSTNEGDGNEDVEIKPARTRRNVEGKLNVLHRTTNLKTARARRARRARRAQLAFCLLMEYAEL